MTPGSAWGPSFGGLRSGKPPFVPRLLCFDLPYPAAGPGSASRRLLFGSTFRDRPTCH